MTAPTMDRKAVLTRRRWGLVVAAVLVQLALGAVYAWSVFNTPLQQQFHWTKAQVVLPFEVAIGTIFIGSMIGGRIQDRYGPRPVALAGGVLYALGMMLSSLVTSRNQLWLLILGYGVMGGIGMGAAYITPIAMLAKWFPDKRGLITGVAVAGFGFGAVITAPAAKWLLSMVPRKTEVFLPLGLAYLVAVLLGASFFRDPPPGYRVPGFVPPSTGRAVAGNRAYTLGEALRTPQWYELTAILALNVTCGIAFISQAADATHAIAGVSGATAAAFVGVLGLFNSAGRVVWAWLSDRIGRMAAFMGMLVLQAICFLALPRAHVFALFALFAALIVLAYGGGFGTMPATAADYFGTSHAGAVYGAMIVAWSIGGVVGPTVTALLYEWSGHNYTVPFTVLAVLALAAVSLPVVTRMPAEPALYRGGVEPIPRH
ncbi:OFA family MFS transporter [Planosporangium flavigriseum]|uniref:MFS transporter n=1 Tax=Planosporangium flavigriseum TaxID=373681 RepID=A0A8J3LV32_9ACTN|nr:OFA family MFS transporter [Planosporangium flavigriseum]NJC65085.1 OFA family MFS transporter [Planosporangium flavigriseum]GIG71700.1 MFS transporter [Planosporangium flavigriseum]